MARMALAPKLARAALATTMVLACFGCHGEDLPDDPRPAASAEPPVPTAASSAWLEPSSATPKPAPAASLAKPPTPPQAL
jgi:hypothetical protein